MSSLFLIDRSPGVSGATAAGGGREHATKEGGQDLRSDGQKPRRQINPGRVPGG